MKNNLWKIFWKINSQNFKILVKKQLILQDFGRMGEKKSPKMEKMGRSLPVKQVFFFIALPPHWPLSRREKAELVSLWNDSI